MALLLKLTESGAVPEVKLAVPETESVAICLCRAEAGIAAQRRTRANRKFSARQLLDGLWKLSRLVRDKQSSKCSCKRTDLIEESPETVNRISPYFQSFLTR